MNIGEAPRRADGRGPMGEERKTTRVPRLFSSPSHPFLEGVAPPSMLVEGATRVPIIAKEGK